MTEEHLGHRRIERRVESRDAVPSDTPISFEFVLRYPAAQQREIDAEAAQLLAGGGRPRSREEAATTRAVDDADVARVREVAEHAGLAVGAVDAHARSIQLTGTAAAVNALFHITLVNVRAGSQTWRDYDGELRTPPELNAIVEAVLGLATTPVA
jgi:hypothetical protein